MDLLTYILSKNGGSGGANGVSPTVSVEDIDGGHRITIVDAEGTNTFDVLDGAKGETGAKGDKGDKGDKGAPGSTGATGADGYSPSVNVTKADGVSTITITDKNGTTTVEIQDGANGKDGSNGKDGTTPVKGSDYFTDAEIEEVANQAANIVTGKGLIVNSSTPDSTKQFQITVDDAGAITATLVE